MIYSLEAADATSPVRSADVNAAVLPPATRGATEVAQVLRQPSLGLPPARVEFPTRPYDPNLALRHVGAAALTDMGVDQFGGFKISGIAEYPFSRASRLEFSGGLRRFGFDREVTTQFLSPRTGAILDEQTRDLETAPAINLGQASMALVYNNAALGPTSPLLGTRSRLELTPTIGDLRWTELLLDTAATSRR